MEKPVGLFNMYISLDGNSVFSMWDVNPVAEYEKAGVHIACPEEDTIQINSFPDGRTLSCVTSARRKELDDNPAIKDLSEKALEYAAHLGWKPGPQGPKVLFESLYDGDTSEGLSEMVFHGKWGPTE